MTLISAVAGVGRGRADEEEGHAEADQQDNPVNNHEHLPVIIILLCLILLLVIIILLCLIWSWVMYDLQGTVVTNTQHQPSDPNSKRGPSPSWGYYNQSTMIHTTVGSFPLGTQTQSLIFHDNSFLWHPMTVAIILVTASRKWLIVRASKENVSIRRVVVVWRQRGRRRTMARWWPVKTNGNKPSTVLMTRTIMHKRYASRPVGGIKIDICCTDISNHNIIVDNDIKLS